MRPNYNWTCHRCSASNVAGASECSACGFPASATGTAIAEAKAPDESSGVKPEADPIAEKTERLLAGSAWLFFPEILLAVGVLLAAPIWAVRLVMHGHAPEAAWLVVFTAAGSALAWFAWKKESKGLMYFAILVVLIGGWSGWSAPTAGQ